ncbi:MAG: peptidylprolyl isomerase [Myxococcota bacterium]
MPLAFASGLVCGCVADDPTPPAGGTEAAAASSSSDDGATPPASTGATTTGSDGSDPGTGTTTAAATGETSADDTGTTSAAMTGLVQMETTMGTILIELYPDESPGTVANFLAYIDAGFYDGTDGMSATIMHRVVPGFVIQGGGLTEQLMPKATMPAIVNEHGNGPINVRGTLSMARLRAPDTATSQFFINVVDNPGLDMAPGYAVFGEVVEGMDVVDAIVAVETTTSPPYEGVPVVPIVITSVTVQ